MFGMSSLIHRFRLPILSGILIGTSYIPFPAWASLFCWVPLWFFWLQQRHLKPVLIGGVVTAALFTLIGFNWVTYVFHEFAHLDWSLALFGMALYALLSNLFVPLVGLLWFWLRPRLRPWAQHLALPVITILAQEWVPTIFEWNFGYTWFWSGMPLYQCAEWIGFQGLSALTVLGSYGFLEAVLRRGTPSGRRPLVWVVCVFIALNLTGLALKARLPQADSRLRVLLVQGNIGNAEKMAAELGQGFQEAILKAFVRKTDEGMAAYPDQVDLIIWPETAFPSVLGSGLKPNRYTETLKSSLARWQRPLMTGAYGYDYAQDLPTNSLFIVAPNGEVSGAHYSKTHLLAFGEYLPGEGWFPGIRNYLPPIGQFARGPGPTVLLEWQGVRLGPQICYESLFPDFSRGLAEIGAQLIVNTTNDSWYGNWQEPWQHLMMTLARGIEFRRPVIRATNTGISSVGLASGQILTQSPLDQPWFRMVEVPYLKQPPYTFYARNGGLLPGLVWGLLIGLVVLGRHQRRHPAN